MKKINYLIVALLAVGSIVVTSCKKQDDPDKKDDPVLQAKDYSKAENWLIKPESATFDVDIFCIYPTCAAEGDSDCVELNDQEKATAVFFFTQGPSCMADSANVYEPYYRQVPLSVAYNYYKPEDFLNVVRSNIGKQDIFASLDYYFANYNNGRPFIICSHSQGSAMTRIVLDEYMPKHPEYMERMIAVYALGFSIPKKWLSENGLKGATGADDYGVIIGYNTEGPGATMDNIVVSSDDYTINPLTWTTTSEYAGVDQNLGSFKVIDMSKGQYEIVEGYADAQIDTSRVALVCTTLDDYVVLPTNNFGDKSLHVYDWKAYYKNIGENAKARIRAYKAAHSK